MAAKTLEQISVLDLKPENAELRGLLQTQTQTYTSWFKPLILAKN